MRTDIKDISHLSGHDFEDLVEQLVKKMGFVVEERKLTADGGIDIFAKNYEPIFEGTYVIQCKRYTHKVGVSAVRDLYGAVHSKNANKGILITNSTFAKPAIDFALNKQLELIDGEKLHGLLQKYKVLEPEKGTVVTPNYVRFLVNNFIPTLKKIQAQVEDIKNKRVYIEPAMCNEKRWIDLLQTRLNIFKSYATVVTNILNQSLTPAILEKEPNMQRISNDCKKILEATEKLVNNYKDDMGIVPPKTFSAAHDKLLGVYLSMFEKVFRIADDIVKITLQAEPGKTYEVSLVFDGDAILELNRAVNEAIRMKEVQKKSGCFIVTATLGNYNHPYVILLREFRDEWLSKRVIGQIFIEKYYHYSPYFANVIRERKRLRWMSFNFVVKTSVWLVTKLLQKKLKE
jgi:hypothetical protein